MKRPDELIPRILDKIKDTAKVVEKRILVDSDLKKHIRNSRIQLEDLDKLLIGLRNSFTQKLGYFPKDGSRILKEINKDTRDMIAKFREWEHKYHKDLGKTFEELKEVIDKKTKEFLEKIEKL
jgi:hypothetical protein